MQSERTQLPSAAGSVSPVSEVNSSISKWRGVLKEMEVLILCFPFEVFKNLRVCVFG